MNAKRGEEGYATLVGAVMCAALVGCVVLAVTLLGGVIAQHRAQVAADMAAIAGAHSLWLGGDACRLAEDTARDNTAEIQRCEIEGMDVIVAVRVRGREAVSRAGPL
ncbi:MULTISPECIES: Rv3654c family TadE-like protein [unclassified Corynebacterium]|uniref:Rv3654c family TadE-like protein n=1 Tax=unclassified Corynebacterium TaxID=2624378 RepID=UPI0029CA0855|nr:MULTISPECIES: Rv3654c family TadE-like protein [unclassified Corynebacterium]WPF66323.1 flp pilus-assembly TadE/G-like family protein [Corynebacterium sp. 22KM0430]WPF68813.1 flp pilus-assembly TadE/G-like family protein [Corynebacterium sp. 21KM1197]